LAQAPLFFTLFILQDEAREYVTKKFSFYFFLQWQGEKRTSNSTKKQTKKDTNSKQNIWTKFCWNLRLQF